MLQIIGSPFSHYSVLLRQRELGVLSNCMTVRPLPLPIYCCLRFSFQTCAIPKLTAYLREKGVVCQLQVSRNQRFERMCSYRRIAKLTFGECKVRFAAAMSTSERPVFRMPEWGRNAEANRYSTCVGKDAAGQSGKMNSQGTAAIQISLISANHT